MESKIRIEQIVEAVPNFSEGRRAAVVAAIVDAIQVHGVHLLDRSSDADHNRTVITIAGAPDAVLEGLFQAVQVAALHIDLHQHRGVHPRLGATDVIPLVPIRNITLEECVILAQRLAQRIGSDLHLPVYLYEAAATRPERRNLADVRRGGFERLLHEIHTPACTPDFGPAQLGPAGAVIVGARQVLIAYNIYLQSENVTIAKAIATAIRESNGGLPAVRALGFLVNGQAQVSVNLVDYHRTPLHVLDRVTQLAHEFGTEIDRSELIGLLPEDALLQTAAHYLKLPILDRQQIIENAVTAARIL